MVQKINQRHILESVPILPANVRFQRRLDWGRKIFRPYGRWLTTTNIPFFFRPSGLNLSVENGSPLKNINLGEVVHLPPTHRRDKVARLRHA